MAVSRINEAGLNVNQYGNRNLILNGAMNLAQRATSASVTDGTNEGYQTLDRWRFVFANNAGGACDISQSTDVPSGYGFSHSYKVDVTTADTSIASGHHIIFHQRIEAQNLRNSGWNYTSSSSYLTLSFWVKSNKTGTYCIDANAVDVGGNFKFVKEFAINTASTWEHKTIKIPGNASLVIGDDENNGMELEWNLQTASDRDNATDNTWHTSDGSRCTSNQVNFFDSTSNEFFITGVQLEVGETATDFEHRTFTDELARCQRYYQIVANVQNDLIGMCLRYNSSNTFCFFDLPVEMRVQPSVVQNGASADIRITMTGNNNNFTSCTLDNDSSPRKIRLNTSTVVSAASDGDAGWWRINNSGGFIALDAEI